MSGERGSALVQVLIMSILLIILATGVMKVMFMNHTIVARVKKSDEHKFWVDACMAQKTALWQGVACAGAPADACDYTTGGGPVVSVSCQAAGLTVFTVNW
ncbi:MAG: hypothetical protein HYZ75_19445 [Elusimicrobia bacterium]|nr:hypothetical protein [Elusimicrobiota bacterium]